MSLDAGGFDVLTFDCYGTLVDWARGIPAALQPIVRNHGVDIDDEQLFEQYVEFESDVEAGPFVSYREVLETVVRRFGAAYNFSPTNAEIERFAESIGKWPLFSDTNQALGRLHEEFRLGVISNVDDELFHRTARQFKISFDEVITGEQVRSYKPNLEPFEAAFTRLGVPPTRLLHVAQSVYHDINPAGRLGLSCVWVRRYEDWYDARTPNTEPELTVPDLATLADTLLA